MSVYVKNNRIFSVYRMGMFFLKVETNRTKRCKHCKEEFLKVKML